MKKFLVVLGVCLFAFAFVAGDLFAYNSNLSVDWVRMPSKYASETPDAAIYNPAGLTKIKDGLYVSASNQSYAKEYEFEWADRANTADNPSLLFPNAYAVYKQNNWAMFLTFTVPDGGGTLIYEDVYATTLPVTLSDVYIDLVGESAWLTYTLGGSFAMNDMISFSSGLRWYTTTQKYDIDVAAFVHPVLGAVAAGNYTTEKKADGMAAFVGFNITPIKDLNIGIQFQSKVRARGSETVTDGGPAVAGGYAGAFAALVELESAGKHEYFEELPAFLNIGIGYVVMPELKVQASGQIVFEKEEKVGGVPVEFEDRKNGYNLGIGAEYAVMPALKVSFGVNYSKTAKTEDSNNGLINSANPGLDSVTIGFGGAYEVIPGLAIELGLLKPIYFSDENADKQELSKTAMGGAIGVTYKVL